VLKRRVRRATMAAALMMMSVPGRAQNLPADQNPPDHVHDMSKMDMQMDMAEDGWHLMHDGILNVLFNHQGGDRGGDELKVPNWWMGMAARKAGGGDLTLTGMLSLDPATVGKSGYREIFQVGEALDDQPLVDRQHPHDLWMQIAAAWRRPLGSTSGLTFAGGIGEPALGPVAFMHRASAAAIPLAPLGHHTFDSTHITFGVATVGFDRGPLAVEASVFNGREPDDRRWNVDFGPMDSVSARVWYRPTASWEFQVSSGHLVEPEELHEGNVVRTTASASFTRGRESGMTAATVGFGMNDTGEVTRHAGFAEATQTWGRTTLSTRLELVQVESELLRLRELPHTEEAEARASTVGAFGVGVLRDIGAWRGAVAAVGASTAFYRVPADLRPTHGEHPVSFQVYVQIRPRAGAMGRMWNMRMGGSPMIQSGTAPAGHQH
jgi:hypothetical protein